MKIYDKNTICPKCLSENFKIKYVAKYTIWKDTVIFSCTRPEHLLCTCTNCKYTWKMLPADVKTT